MRETFPEYYVNKKEINFHKLDKSILVVLDTNILLDLYRGSKKLRGELKKSLSMIEDNVWMPYQVGFEFNRNRKLIVHGLANEKKLFPVNLSSKLLKVVEDSIESFSTKNILFKEMIDENNHEFERINEVIKDSLENIGENFNQVIVEDQLPFIEKIFSGKVANNTNYNYDEWEKEGQKRYEINTPPGYKDLKEKKDEYYFIRGQRVGAAYGDFFLWKELILKAKDEKIKEIVFITKDVKEDWFYETKGMKIGARVELVEEMLRESDTNFRIYTSSSFLSKTSEEKDYKMIEKEIVKSEEPSVHSYQMDELEYQNHLDKNHYFNNLIYKNENLSEYINYDKFTNERIYELMKKINNMKHEIETELSMIKSRLLHSKVLKYVFDLEEEFHEIIIDYENLLNLEIHSIQSLKKSLNFSEIEMVYFKLQKVLINLVELYREIE